MRRPAKYCSVNECQNGWVIGFVTDCEDHMIRAIFECVGGKLKVVSLQDVTMDQSTSFVEVPDGR